MEGIYLIGEFHREFFEEKGFLRLPGKPFLLMGGIYTGW
jgi:hypothetical protein